MYLRVSTWSNDRNWKMVVPTFLDSMQDMALLYLQALTATFISLYDVMSKLPLILLLSIVYLLLKFRELFQFYATSSINISLYCNLQHDCYSINIVHLLLYLTFEFFCMPCNNPKSILKWDILGNFFNMGDVQDEIDPAAVCNQRDYACWLMAPSITLLR